MNGILRIVDRLGVRECPLPKGESRIGSETPGTAGATETISIALETAHPAPITLRWDRRRGTWSGQVADDLPFPLSLNSRRIAPGEAFCLIHLDTLELPGVYLQFSRELDIPLFQQSATDIIPLSALSSGAITFGRAQADAPPEQDRVDLDPEEVGISREHAIITREGNDTYLEDRSRAGTELNGASFTRERLVFGDRFRISGYLFEFAGVSLRRIDPERSGSIRARDLRVIAGGRAILDGVSLDIAAGEFIGILGGSGQGKSTLLNALCGISQPSSGGVWIGNAPISDRARLREIGVGLVPQDDIVHQELTVHDAITFSAKLRLRLTSGQIRALVSGVIARLGLAEHARKRVSHLSGGQRKRVSIAIELLAKPSVLFLDEPSSGLDPATEESLMTLLQSLTLTKLTVVCTTHVLQKAYLFDRVLFIQGGKLIFSGNSDEARSHFLQQETSAASGQFSPLEKIYSLLASGDTSPAEWEAQFLQSPLATKAISPLPVRQESGPASTGKPAERSRSSGNSRRSLSVSMPQMIALLFGRQWKIISSEPLNFVFLLAQPLLIGLLIGWVSDSIALRMFLCVVATLWFGCSNGAQQIVAERPIFRRERVCGMGLNTYLLSKLSFLSVISGLQAVLMLMTTLTIAFFAHPENLEIGDLESELRSRFTSPESAQAAVDDDTFEAIAETAPAAGAAAPAAPVAATTPAPAASSKSSDWIPGDTLLSTLAFTSRFFQLTPNLLDSGETLLMRLDGSAVKDEHGEEIRVKGESVFGVLFTTISLRFLAIAAAAITGVAIGLTISALVNNTTQAVLWVPLVLIPQILFGGVVVTIPEMSASVRTLSALMPSAAAQRIMDVASLFGNVTPFMSNRTKAPLFLTARGEKDTIDWEEDGKSYSQSYDRLSPVNLSWQNLTVIPENLGQHKPAGERSADGFRFIERDTVTSRHDVRYTKGTLYRSLSQVQTAALILTGWTLCGYGLILFGLNRR